MSIENLLVRIWNRLITRKQSTIPAAGLRLGHTVRDGQMTRAEIRLSIRKRTEHMVILGRTGSGKTSLMKFMISQDIAAGRGFIVFVFHRDVLLFCLKVFASLERRSGIDLSAKLIVIAPADAHHAVGFNPLEAPDPERRFLQVSEFSEILHERWGMERLGARTSELLRNVLFLLSASGDTLLEARLALTNPQFLESRLTRLENPEVAAYFRERYLPLSPAMRTVMSAPILDRLGYFAADPHFRYIVGQAQSTFSLLQVLDDGCWLLLDLDKGQNGPEATTLGALFLSKIKHSIFARRERSLVSLYLDEVQNLLTSDGSGLEIFFAEARKQGISAVCALQFLSQLPIPTRHAAEAVGTHICFQLAHTDADHMAAALDGGKALGELLRNLPQRQFVSKSGHERWQQAVVPEITDPDADFADLYRRCQKRWALPKTDVERDIRNRQAQFPASNPSRDALQDWE